MTICLSARARIPLWSRLVRNSPVATCQQWLALPVDRHWANPAGLVECQPTFSL